MHLFKDTKFDFLRWRFYALGLSALVVAAGIAMIYTKGIPKGVEFAGGTVVIEQFDQAVSIEQVRDVLVRYYPGGGQNAVVQPYGNPSQRMVMIRVPVVGAEAGEQLAGAAQAIEDALRKGNLGGFRRQGAEIVGPTVGQELTSKGIWATVLSLIGILAYLAFRFQFSFGVGAVVATIHDLLVTFAFLAFFQYDLTLNVIAALLTITGYSTNDTIVIFDRVRENTRLSRREPLESAINTSLNQTLTRTVITSGTVFLSVMALYLFGGEVLEAFAFTMLAGTIATTYSGWFIAPSLAIMLSRKPSAAPARAVADGASGARPKAESAGGGLEQPSRKSKSQRKARAT